MLEEKSSRTEENALGTLIIIIPYSEICCKIVFSIYRKLATETRNHTIEEDFHLLQLPYKSDTVVRTLKLYVNFVFFPFN